MSVLLADHNVEGHARLLMGALQALGWVDALDIRLVTFIEVGLTGASTDREVWQRAQERGMLLLTANRNKSGTDSLEQVLREEHAPQSLPVLTVSQAKKLLNDRAYRNACAERIAEIVLDLDAYRGIPRLFIP